MTKAYILDFVAPSLVRDLGIKHETIDVNEQVTDLRRELDSIVNIFKKQNKDSLA